MSTYLAANTISAPQGGQDCGYHWIWKQVNGRLSEKSKGSSEVNPGATLNEGKLKEQM